MTNLGNSYKIFLDKISEHKNSALDNGRLLQYLNAKGIDYMYIPDGQKEIPLIDQILHYSKKDEKKILIVNLKTITKLCLQQSKYNNFLQMVRKNELKLIYYQFGDDLLMMYKLLMSTRPDDVRLSNILQGLEFSWWSSGKVGKYFHNHFEKVHVEQLPCFVFGFICGHFSTLATEYEKTNTFFTLTKLSAGQIRQHRNHLIEKIKDQPYTGHAILKSTLINDYTKKKSLFDDLQQDYGKTFLDHWPYKDMLPAISYYKKTYFELVTETLGATGSDDSFFLTDKTLKPIIMGHPFILLSTKHMLKNLRQLGFKTFHQHIDESYDESETLEEKVEIISKNLKRLDLAGSKKFYDSTREIRAHNQKHLLYLIGSYEFELWKAFNKAFKKIEF